MTDAVDTVAENHPAWKHAKQGEVYRKQGMLPEAIHEFNEAIRLAPPGLRALRAYAHARRGAAKMDMGFVTRRYTPDLPDDGSDPISARAPGALEDLEEAAKLARGDGWTDAHMADAYRIFMRDRFRWMVTSASPEANDGPLDFDTCVREAKRLYDRGIDSSLPEQNAWLRAHRGALLFSSLWALFDLDTGRFPNDPAKQQEFRDLVAEAADDLSAAIDARSNYAWAKRVKAGVLAAACAEPISSPDSATEKRQQRRRRFEEAMQLLGEASVDDPRSRLQDLRGIAMLARYAAQTVEAAPERKLFLKRALQSSQYVLNDDVDDIFAGYVRASALLDSAESEVEERVAAEVCRETRDRLLNQLVRSLAITLAIHNRMNGTAEQFDELIARAMEKVFHDTEILSMGNLDAAWSGDVEGRAAHRPFVKNRIKSLTGKITNKS